MKRDWSLFCDRVTHEGRDLRRVGVFEGKSLIDLYYDRLEEPDLSGAVVTGRAVRVMAGGKAAWFEAALPEKLYVETHQPVRTGQCAALRIQTTFPKGASGGKAWPASLCSAISIAPEEKLGLLQAPPMAFQRALYQEARQRLGACYFTEASDRALFLKHEPTESKRLGDPQETNYASWLDEVEEGLSAPRVALPSGGSLVIERTEALIAIDVNAGEGNHPLSVNLLAAREAARQIRLRQLGGLIVMDALKMTGRTDRDKFLKTLADCLALDPAGPRVFGLTKLGLVEMTRPRRGPSFAER